MNKLFVITFLSAFLWPASSIKASSSLKTKFAASTSVLNKETDYSYNTNKSVSVSVPADFKNWKCSRSEKLFIDDGKHQSMSFVCANGDTILSTTAICKSNEYDKHVSLLTLQVKYIRMDFAISCFTSD